ncbi:MAG: YbjN domain-containing protein [Nitrospira sp.]|nr:YbjN domain-containing protein [Nitrospira sp.]MDW8224333.1 YbjN domain-containing protein [Gemmatales bacterium]
MSGLFSSLIDYMEDGDWRYEILEGETIIRFQFKGRSGRVLCYGEVDEPKCWLTFYSYLPVNTPEAKMAQMAEFISRANRGLRIGNFELDYDDGEIRYKTSIDVEGGELTPKMIDNLLRANLTAMDRYFPGFMELIYGEKPAAELIRKIESPGGVWELDGEEDEEMPFMSDEEDDDDESTTG